MKAEIVEIEEWYNSKGELIQHTITYESNRKYGCFEKLPKKAENGWEGPKKAQTTSTRQKQGTGRAKHTERKPESQKEAKNG